MGESTEECVEQYFDQVTEMDSKSVHKPNITMLVLSQSDNKGPNIMTASWWMLASFWPFRYMLSVSHKSYTYEILQDNPEFTFAVPTVDMIDALTLCGMVSGRDLDKLDHLGLETLSGTEINVPLLKNAVGNLECSVTEKFEHDSVTFYLAKVEKAYIKKGMLDGRILSAEGNPLAYMGSDWHGENDDTKHRFYVDFDAEDIRSYRGSEIVDTLPPEIREKVLE